jgi:hypothetical protein
LRRLFAAAKEIPARFKFYFSHRAAHAPPYPAPSPALRLRRFRKTALIFGITAGAFSPPPASRRG